MAVMEETGPIALDGARKERRNLTDRRIRLVVLALALIFAVVGGRLIQIGLMVTDTSFDGRVSDAITATRPAILDADGRELAVDIRVPSLFAEPNRIIDVDEAVEKLLGVMPDLDPVWLRDKLDGEEGFVWLMREITPALRERIFQLGIPGIGFLTESKRFYPGGTEAAHIMGAVNIDNQGIAGIERHIDDDGLALLQEFGIARDAVMEPVNLSIDLRVQHVLHEQLTDAMERYQAIAAAGVLLNVRTGEIVGLVSLPDFDPNRPATALQPVDGRPDARINRITAGVYELGSTFKAITIAGALDSGRVHLTDTFDARFGVRFGRFTIDDFHGQHRILNVPEVFKYSSNVGAIRIMQALGEDNFRAFISRVGFDESLTIELPETRRSSIPDRFSEIVAATASFGHGLSITPLHMAAAMAGIVNDGLMIPPTLYPRTEEEALALSRRIISPETSAIMRYLLRLNALEGSGSRANRIATGLRMGGKTGTAEKVVNGGYDPSRTLAVFTSVFPMDDPQYTMIILIDEPERENEQSGRTAGWNAGEVTGRIVQRVAPLLGIAPNFDEAVDAALVPHALRTVREPAVE
jgi:cell division protein FtsI (penicillin-binding protein 3)